MAPARRSIPCEVDYRSHGETVLVLPNLKKTTVNLSADIGLSLSINDRPPQTDQSNHRTGSVRRSESTSHDPPPAA
jgi:hypothetical protein